MRWRRARRVAAALLLIGAAALWAAPAAGAHEIRNVGAYRFVVGWGTEPAFAGQENSVQLILSSRRTGRPVVDLGSTLHVSVVFGSRTMTLALEPMINMGGWQVYVKPNNWTVVTRDGRPSAHFEHTVAITQGEAEILTKHG